MYRPPLPPEPDSGWRVVLPGSLGGRTFADEEVARTALNLARALGIDDAHIVRVTGPCEWYALCTNAATGTTTHPVLGDVPICQRCAERHGLPITEFEKETS